MAHHKSALKAIRHSERSRARIKSHKSSLKTATKQFRALVDADDVDAARKTLSPTVSLIDHKAALGIIPKNRASRYKSRLSRALNKAAAKS
ncbi:MAG: 30S ribosomal protein S20 [Acidobacteriota bacterium]